MKELTGYPEPKCWMRDRMQNECIRTPTGGPAGLCAVHLEEVRARGSDMTRSTTVERDRTEAR